MPWFAPADPDEVWHGVGRLTLTLADGPAA